MWDTAPWTPKEWTNPRERIRLVQSRIICNDDPILDPANPKRSCRITIRYYDFQTKLVHTNFGHH